MNASEIDKAIERLKAMDMISMSAYEVAVALMGNRNWLSLSVRDELVDVLMKARSNWWVNKSGKEDLDTVSDRILAEWGYTRLPKDKDGKTIRIGDTVQYDPDDGVKSPPFEVRGMTLDAVGNGWEVYADGCTFTSVTCRHHDLTVEDILAEFENEWDEAAYANADEREGFADDAPSLIIRYADRLRKLLEKDEP